MISLVKAGNSMKRSLLITIGEVKRNKLVSYSHATVIYILNIHFKEKTLRLKIELSKTSNNIHTSGTVIDPDHIESIQFDDFSLVEIGDNRFTSPLHYPLSPLVISIVVLSVVAVLGLCFFFFWRRRRSRRQQQQQWMMKLPHMHASSTGQQLHSDKKKSAPNAYTISGETNPHGVPFPTPTLNETVGNMPAPVIPVNNDNNIDYSDFDNSNLVQKGQGIPLN